MKGKNADTIKQVIKKIKRPLDERRYRMSEKFLDGKIWKRFWKLIDNHTLFKVFVIYCIVYGAVFYSLYSPGSGVKRIWTIIWSDIQNIIQALAFSANISVIDAYRMALETNHIVVSIMHYIYMVAVCATPLMAGAAIWDHLKIYLKNRRRNIPFEPSKVSIYGKSPIVDNIFRTSDHENIIYYMHEKPSDEERAAYLEHKIFPALIPIRDDFKIFEDYKLTESEKIVLCDMDPVANFNMLGKIVQYFKNISDRKEGDENSQPDDIKVLMLCQNVSVKHLYQQLFMDAKKQVEQKQSNEDQNRENQTVEDQTAKKIISNIDLINIAPHKIEIRKMLKEYPLYYYQLINYDIKKANDPSFWNQHIVIIGFGDLGQEMLMQCMNAAVLHSKSDIRFDVYDMDIKRAKGELLKNFTVEAFTHVSITENQKGNVDSTIVDCLELKGEKDYGCLKIYFHEVNVYSAALDESLNNIHKEMPVTYSAVCFPDDETALTAAMSLDKIFDENERKSITIFLHLETYAGVCRFIDEDKKRYYHIKVSSISNNEINLEYLLDYAGEFEPKIIHYLLNVQANFGSNKLWEEVKKIYSYDENNDSKKNILKVWKSADINKKESARTIYHYQNNKIFKVAELYYRINKNFVGDISFEEFLKDVRNKGYQIFFKTNSRKIFECINSSTDEQQFINNIHNNAIIEELGAMEHRRQYYYLYSKGLQSETDNPEYTINDFIPYLLLKRMK